MQPSAQKIYLIHGWGVNRHVFDDFITRLPAAWDVHLLNLPGHGTAAVGETFDIERVADEFARQIEHPAHILGWSLGGLVALYLAARHPQKIQSLCLTASFAKLLAADHYPEGLNQVALGKMIALFQQDYAKHIKLFLQLQLLHTPDAAAIIERILPDIVRHGAPTALRDALNAAEHADARHLLPHIRQPSLLIFGGKDAITPSRMGGYLHRHLPHSRLHIIEKAAHAPFLSHADEFAAHYRSFIDAQQHEAAE